ncbi:glucose/quinate/shikimate family membrane-bound PQQ-dependent dehydrogenase [Rhizobiaceae bacterium BDR2-2]|uniref:Glucose/quinate/shikimate family membrane-bound PQQ-dependent dehydrogenase n=1 Tax=Ectorhizobium quercum TaxID=2965071 RepID=A0AAE3N134_9HYPH|nr:glucose/quinate/shikimate family membrane-bound PQQ-dependent dehydrogenase [Ectorhizobium quercum]MCX8997365.1 glucose/quinate/shikimate family membrane-bound PQQ-dependent dehydrogenase [Ectorhizobium quercum]
MNQIPEVTSLPARIWLAVLGAVIALAGLFFAVGGAKLVWLGGSWYFLIAGLFLIASGVLTVRRKPAGGLLFGLVFVATVLWSVWEVGFDFWPLISRLLAISVGAVVVALSFPLLRRASGRTPAYKTSFAAAAVVAIAAIAGFAGMFVPHPVVTTDAELPLVAVTPETEQKNWEHYGNTLGSSRFVALDQITRDNIKDLEVAWTYHTGDVPLSPGNSGAEDQQTPLQVGNTLYLCTPHNNIIAIEADTGTEIWRNDINAQATVWNRCRGLTYYDATRPIEQPTVPGSTPVTPVALAPDAPCQRRIIMNTINAELIEVDADDGSFCADFGVNGRVDLKEGLGEAGDPQYQLTSPPTLAGTTVVVGGRVADNVQVDMPGGVLRGFDVITGEMRWAFDPGNPEQRTLPPEGQTYTRSTPNSWAGMTYDPASNTVFLPMGSPSVDLYGATRSELDHKYGATVLALDATTGDEKWVFQSVHNDLWDFDLPMPPTLIDFPRADGSTVPALVIGSKSGQIFVLDRATGTPLTEVREVPVKPADIPNEPYSPTQPLSVGMPQIGTDHLTEADMWGATPFDQLLCRISFKSMRYEGLFTAPGQDVSLSFPGSLGGMNWGGISVDPVNDLIFVNDMRVGLWIQMIATTEDTGRTSDGSEAINTGMGLVPMKGTPYAVNKDRFLSPAGIPCQKPPYGTLSAIDMKTQQIRWQVPVGTVMDQGPMGIKMGLPIPIGMPTLGSTLTTQGGLVFIAGTQDYYLRAYSTSTGEEVWKARLPVGSQGGPVSYKSPRTGKQYVVISAGGARQSADRGDYVIAYALPD